MGWWDFAVRAFGLLTTPRADIARCDRDVETLARNSVAGGVVHRSSLAVRLAWTESRTRWAAQALATAVVGSGGTAAWRVGGWMAAVAGATVLLLNPFATRDSGPLIWVTPALAVLAGLLVMACSAPLARAATDRRRRSSSSTQ